MTKEKAINFLYNDWLDYKKYYKNKMNFNMKETFIEYLEREIPEYIESKKITKDFILALNDFCFDHYKHFNCYPLEFEYNNKIYKWKEFERYINDN